MSCNSPCANPERRRCLGLLALAAWPTAPRAAAPAMPSAPEVIEHLPQARLQGSGTYRWWGLAIYDVTLWVQQPLVPEGYAQAPFALVLRYARDLVGQQIAERSLTEMRRIGPVSDAQAGRWLAAMRAAFPDVAAGDRLVGLHHPTQPTRFLHNGRPTASVADPAFAALFFGIWLSPRSTEPALQRALYGQTS